MIVSFPLFMSIQKFSEPTDVNRIAVSWTAGVGISLS